MKQEMQTLLNEQLETWELARNNYAALSQVKIKEVTVDGTRYKVQFNPARIVSSAAKVDAHSIQTRQCFLCPAHLPVAQKGLPFKEGYQILVNPFPIFPKHLTVPALEHVGQRILTRFADMLDLAVFANEYVVFYNGPRCGASAPDHVHFQAGNKGFLPIEQQWEEQKGERIADCGNATLWQLDDRPRTTLVIESTSQADAVTLFNTVYRALEVQPGEEEPMINLLAWVDNTTETAPRWMVCIFPREKHRPSCYTAQGEANILISPASVDMGGVFIIPRLEDFERMTATDIATILSEVCLPTAKLESLKQRIRSRIVMKEPNVQVGILFAPQVEFVLLAPYGMEGVEVSGHQTAIYDSGRIRWNNRYYNELLFTPTHAATDAFELLDVTIGINFHWERKENQRFQGALKLIVEDEKLTVINVIGVENYLTSVISSEMSATASMELLKAHAVISRSWLLCDSHSPTPSQQESVEGEVIRWYERDAHTHFDVCADDHCQRYQGITRASTPLVRQAIEATRGEVLTSEGRICDTRFSKCCGGAFEEFQYCWEEVKYPYLTKQRDSKTTPLLPDLRIEAEAERWIRTSPEAFCNTTDERVLAQVLNNYDRETTDFYRWRVEYSQAELAALIHNRSGIDYGKIIDLRPIERGVSGRIVKLMIVGTKRTITIGKELEIRRTLSTSHLYSSAFVIDRQEMEGEIPGRFVLTGAGWGHGVGLCQIGAAMMGEQGYKYDAILLHYYAGAEIEKRYQ